MPFLHRSALPALCLSLLFTSAFSAQAADAPAPAAEKPVERQPLPERSQAEASALERTIPQQEQQQLQAGSDSFLALWKPANSAEPDGVVIIVPGAGENADWPQAISPLRHKLPDANWGSLSLSLPDVSVDTLPPRVMEAPKATVDTSSKEASTADKPIEQAASAEAEGTDPAVVPGADEQDKTDASRIFDRIDAAVAFAQTQSARSVVLLGHGTGAWWAARYLSEKQPSQVQKFVMVGAQTPNGRHPDVQQLAPALKLPTADVFYQDNAQSRKNALARVQAAKRLKNDGYKQVSLKALPGNSAAEQEQLYRRVRGWLSPQAKTD
ncbi:MULTISPECIES: alpha/beta hydrolase family protein [Pseudomonas]|uniref:Lipoprotein n=1 Tax=Pseudomonas fluorescens LMG 5329 TaxID=1324332 RepID=A0A0A1Z960_PSEFL|nr:MULTISPECIES: alpha/beta hydrolase family protein [Pseudomonas]KGE69327.1 lipoprotein [Pseudomonas fluorescens LMG 5329]NWD99230.1 alpha/beta hydrolase family protein [Pseudomonas sp. IPO3749]NWF20536.1 alpha/beta hydrolase family protein [Pseudomonas sp. IPO3749]